MKKFKDFCGAICFLTLTIATIWSIIWANEFYVNKQETTSPEEDEEDVEEYDE